MNFSISATTEARCQQMLRDYYNKRGASKEYIQSQIDYIFPQEGGFVERFNYVSEHLEPRNKKHLLISGAAVGSEIIQGKRFGFAKVTGTEVSEIYTQICKVRLTGLKGTTVDYYNGMDLPYKDNTFTCIMSGHIIEHTKSPFKYLNEHLRVLQPGGIFFLEFPDRNHHIELHTGTKSFESQPLWLRGINLFVRSIFIPNADLRRKYHDVLHTLKPISIKDILKWISKTKFQVEVVSSQFPHPGFTRVILRKL